MAPCLRHAGIRVSADTKTCGSPLNPAPAGVLCLPSGKHTRILTDFQTEVKKETGKKRVFWAGSGVLPALCCVVKGQILITTARCLPASTRLIVTWQRTGKRRICRKMPLPHLSNVRLARRRNSRIPLPTANPGQSWDVCKRNPG